MSDVGTTPPRPGPANRDAESIRAVLETVGPWGPIRAIRKLPRRPLDFPVHVWAADLRPQDCTTLAEATDRLPACGVGFTSEAALASALGEAVERYAFSRCALGPGAIVDRPPTPLGEAEIVRLPVLLSRSLRSLKRTVRLVAAQKEWAWLRILRKDGTSGHDRVCAPLALLFADRSTTLLASSSNGVAAGPNHTFAALRGLCELIERDAFMVAWYHRYPGARVDEAHILPADVVDWVRRQRACSIDFRLHDISSDLGFHVFLAYVVEYRGQQPVSFSCGAGCSLDPCEAASRAFLEAALSWRGGTELVSLRGRLSEAARAAFRPVTFSDHLFLYQHRGSLGWVSHLLDAPQCERTYTCASTESTIARQLQDAITTLERRGYKAYFLDMTPAEFRSFDLSVVRIVVPGLVPLVWGRYRPVFSDRLKSPSWIPARDRRRYLNPDPHPFP